MGTRKQPLQAVAKFDARVGTAAPSLVVISRFFSSIDRPVATV
jgi:hypothetical protein